VKDFSSYKSHLIFLDHRQRCQKRKRFQRSTRPRPIFDSIFPTIMVHYCTKLCRAARYGPYCGHETSLIAGAFYEVLETKTTAARIYRVVIKRRSDLWLPRFIRCYSQSWCTPPESVRDNISLVHYVSFISLRHSYICILWIVIFYARSLSFNLQFIVFSLKVCRFYFLDIIKATRFLQYITNNSASVKQKVFKFVILQLRIFLHFITIQLHKFNYPEYASFA